MWQHYDLKEIDNITLSKIFCNKSSLIKRTPINEDLDRIAFFNPDEPLIESLFLLEKSTSYYRVGIEWLKDYMFDKEEIEVDLDNFDELDESDIKRLKGATNKKFWKYRLLAYKNQYLTFKEKEKKIPKKEDLWHEGNNNINNFLNNIPKSLRGKTLDVLHDSEMHNVNDYIYCEEDINNLDLYDSSIFSEGEFLNKLFIIREDGIGKGEVLISYLFKNSSINGQSESFDIVLGNNEHVEVKSINATRSFRFGTKAGIVNYKFYREILYNRKMLKNYIEKIGIDKFKKSVNKNLYDLSIRLIDDLSVAINSGELSPSKLELINLWYVLAHMETNKSFIKEFCSLFYVKDPMSLIPKINEEIKTFFRNIDYLVVFDERDKQTRICTSPEGIAMDNISQNGIKVAEKNCARKRDDSLEKAFKLWSKDNSLNFYKMYTDLKNI